ncbi:unnamed protein product [Linum trigynum]|uniref:Uncharacterized protein n=1 Tax=Linum trigynum TaxID=586398 RepID=A0AAV2DDX0_9ROSI
MGLDLISYIDGTGIVPLLTITENDATGPNPAHHCWFRQDKLILHALRCSIFESLYSFVSGAATSREAWLILEKLYGGRSQSGIINLKGKLASMTKGNNDVLTYVNDLKLVAAELALVNDPVSDMDLVVHYLRGLGEDYKQFTAAVCARSTVITIEDLVDSLVEFEADLKAQTRHSSVPTVFYSGHSRRGGNGGFSHGGGGFSPVGSPSSSGGPQSSLDSIARPQQPMGQQAHSYDSAHHLPFYPPARQPTPGPLISSEPNRPCRAQVVCQYCERPGHSVRQCFKLFPQARQAFTLARQAEANHTTAHSGPSSSGSWLMDTTAADGPAGPFLRQRPSSSILSTSPPTSSWPTYFQRAQSSTQGPSSLSIL